MSGISESIVCHSIAVVGFDITTPAREVLIDEPTDKIERRFLDLDRRVYIVVKRASDRTNVVDDLNRRTEFFLEPAV